MREQLTREGRLQAVKRKGGKIKKRRKEIKMCKLYNEILKWMILRQLK